MPVKNYPTLGPIRVFSNYSAEMNIHSIGNKHGIRLLLKDIPLTKRIATKELLNEGISPLEYINREMNALGITHSTIEVTQVNGSSFMQPVTFEYSLPTISTHQLQKSTQEMETHIPLSGPLTGIVYVGHEGFLAKQYEKWYYDEAERCRQLRNELDQTTRELHTAKNELQLVNLRTELENKQKEVERKQFEFERDVEWERQKEHDAKAGLNGIMDTFNNSTFLQGIAEKLIDGFILQRGKGLSGLPKVDNPELQQALEEIIRCLAQMAATDSEHFGLVSLIVDKCLQDKELATYIFTWLNSQKQTDKNSEGAQATPPQQPPV